MTGLDFPPAPMHTQDLAKWRHEHVFDSGNTAAERSTRWVLWLTAATMVVEIAAGWLTNSMALLADGLHMSSHAAAIGLSAFAYAAARRHAQDPRFAFGTWKIEVLGGYTSAVFLLGVVALMAYGSILRLLQPEPIQYAQAMLVAGLGLAVNLLSARLLGAAQPDHHHSHSHHHGHGQDLNLKSAYLHVIADAATSVAAIVALAGAWLFGWTWLDPVMGLAGAVVVALWAKGLLVDTGKVLLDREMDHPLVQEIRDVVAQRGASGDTLISDLHVWRVGKAAYACALGLVTHDPALTPAQVREWLSVHEEIVHSTIEIQRCPPAGSG